MRGRKFAALALALAISLLLSSCLLLIDEDPVESFVPQSMAKISLEKPSDVQAEHPCPCFLGGEGNEEPLRPLEHQKELRTQKVKSEEELLNAVMNFRKPFFLIGSTLRQLYDAAVETLNTIISEEMSDFEKVHAIYDFLVYYVDYDFGLYQLYQQDKSKVSGNENAFKLEGVFFDRKAVCDGISKAFALMCSIECIPNVRIVGSKNGVPHAWNKVRLGGKWYLVDATWGNYALSTSGEDGEAITEYLTHACLLIADDESYKEEKVYPANLYTAEDVKASESYGFYSKSYIPDYFVLGQPQDWVIETQLEFVSFLGFIAGRQLSVAEFYSEMSEEELDLLSLNYKIKAVEYGKNLKLQLQVQRFV